MTMGVQTQIEQHDKTSKLEDFKGLLLNFEFNEGIKSKKTLAIENNVAGLIFNRYINEFWTSRQRQASPIHEISYRACFKPQLPAFFIDRLSKEHDVVYDPFGGRGTTIIEAALRKRAGISNDINPLSRILAEPRIFPPAITDIENRLLDIPFDKNKETGMDLSMFFHSDTLGEIISLKEYLYERKKTNREDRIDKWIRMVATNRLTGHSSGFFSVYTLPPNQAVSRNSQAKINEKRHQKPDYRDVKRIIMKKSRQLLGDMDRRTSDILKDYANKSIFITADARHTSQIDNNTIQLTVTSPPFLDIVQYSNDNWLRCWFNGIDDKKVAKQITMSRTLDDWSHVMGDVFVELYRITRQGGWVAFEVGEVRKGSIKLDEYIAPLGIKAGFKLFGVVINSQVFTKTSNIWGINNNESGTNTNRIVVFYKSEDGI